MTDLSRLCLIRMKSSIFNLMDGVITEMLKVFVLLGIFIVFIYVYSFIKLKKNREKTKNLNSIQDFHDSYRHLVNKQIPQEKSNSYKKYITKYNSSEDYREK